MAKISTYPEQQPPSLDDYVIGTSVSNALATKNYLISDIIGLATLDEVLTNGNTSLLDAKIGELYLYDTSNQDYGKIQLSDSEYNLYNSSGDIITTISSIGAIFRSNAYYGFLNVPDTITANRTYEFPNQSGVVALVSDIPFGKIKIEDPSEVYFNDLSSAHAYISLFTNNVLYDETFHDGVYRFSVAPGSNFNEQGEFCNDNDMLFEDPDGLVISFGSDCFVRNQRNNIFGNITVGTDFLYLSTGNNIIGTVLDTSGNFLKNSDGNNIIKGGQFLNSFLAGSTGNNIIGNITVGDDAFKNSTGNNTINIITVGANCFQNASPTIKNTVYQILDCDNGFAENYTGRMDVGLWGTDSTLNLPNDIFTTSNLSWIHTFWSNKFNYIGGQDLDLFNVIDNIGGNPNSVVFFD